MILSDDEIIGIKDYAELTGKLRLIAKDCNWQLLEDAADTIDELRRDAARYRWLRLEHDRTDPLGRMCWKRYDNRNGSEWCEVVDIDAAIDAAIKESK